MTDNVEKDRGDAIARLLQRAGPRPAVPVERAARVRAVVHDRWSEKVLWRRRRKGALWALASLATAAMALIGVRVGFWSATGVVPGAPIGVVESVSGTVRIVESGSRLRVRIGDTLSSGSWLETEGRGRAALRLASGPSLRLDRETRIGLESPSSFRLDRGAVYVDTGSSPAGGTSLEIRTALGVARDIGTQFEVRLEDDDLLLRVREGLVQFSRQGLVYDTPSGNEISMDAGGDVERRSLLPYGSEWDWVADIAPPFALEGTSLEDFLAQVTREKGWTLRFDDSVDVDTASTIVLEGPALHMKPEQALRTVLPTCGLGHRTEDGTLWILDPNRRSEGRGQ